MEHFSAVAEKRRSGWQPQLALELAFIQASQPEDSPVSPTAVSTAIPPVVKETHAPAAPNTEKKAPRRENVRSRNTSPKPENDAPAVETAAVNPAKDQPNSTIKSPLSQNNIATAAQIDENWNDIIQIMRPVSLGALLRDASVAGIDEQNHLVLAFQHTFHCERVNEPSNRRAIEDALAEKFNQKISVRCLMHGEWQAPKQVQPAANLPQTQPESAPEPSVIEGDSLIRRAQEELGAVAKVDGI